MSKIKRHVSIVLSLLLMVVMVMPTLSGCADETPEQETVCTVTFDKNTSHTTNTIQPQTVDNGKTVKQPQVFVTDADETNRFTVTGWYTSKDCKDDEKWNFADPVTKSMTLYAAWQEKVKVEFYLGVTAENPSSTQWVVKGGKAEREDGLVGNYKLEGYFTDTDYNNEFSFDSALNSDQKLYLKYDSTIAYLTPTYLAAMTPGYDKQYTYVTKYCPVHRVEEGKDGCPETDCTATLVDPATVTTLYCPDCDKDIAKSEKAEDGTHTACEANVTDHAQVLDPAGDVAAKQRPDDFYPWSIKKATQAATEDDEALEYVRFDFGNLEQPYVWYNPLNIDIKNKNVLTVKYRNMGLGKIMRFYYVVGYRRQDGQYNYSGNGVFAKYVDIDIKQDKEWHTQDIDMGAETVSDTDGISEWGTADLLAIFRFDYPYDRKEYSPEKVKPGENGEAGDSVLDVAEITFSENNKDYSAKDTLEFATEGEGAYATEVPTDATEALLTDWTWTADEDAGLYYKGGEVTVYFPYGEGASKLTATVATGKTVNCDSAEKKALFIGYDNLGYATSAKISWVTDDDGDEQTGEKNISLESRKTEQVLYVNMEKESTWSGTLKSLTLTYVNKGVNNAIVISSVKIATPKVADIPGLNFESGPMGFDDDAYSATNKALIVDATGVVKTAVEGGTVLDVNNAIVYKGFTVWYTQGTTAATKLTLTYTDAENKDHSKEVDLASGEGEKSVSVAFLDANDRSAMSGKIKALKLSTDKGTVAVRQIDYDLDVHNSYFDLTKEGSVTTGVDATATAQTATNFGKACSVEGSTAIANSGITYAWESNKNAWQLDYTVSGAQAWWHLSNLVHPVQKSVLKDRKIYVIVNNATASTAWNVYVWFNGSGGAPISPCGQQAISIAPEQRKMGENEWTVVEIPLSGKTVLDDYDDLLDSETITQINGFMINIHDGIGKLYIRGIIFR